MDNILVIGAGGVSHVTIHKMAQNPNYFKNIILASKSMEKCFQIKNSVKDKYNIDITVADINGDVLYLTESINNQDYKSGPHEFELSKFN